MKDLDIGKNTTITAPDANGAVEIHMWSVNSGNNSEWIQFKELEEWVSMIREQIIKEK